MPNYSYEGRNLTGLVAKGVIEAQTSAEAADILLGRGITPIEIKATSGQAEASGSLFARLFGNRVSHEDIRLFSRQFHTLLKAGVPIMGALASLQGAAASQAMAAVLKDLRQSLDWGRDLASAMVFHPKVFPPFYIAMVRVGEMTGRLDQVFLRLYHHLDFERFMRHQVKAALRYPSFVVMAMFGAIVAVNLLVIPTFAQIFSTFKAELPLTTRMLLASSAFMTHYWYTILLAAAAAYYAFSNWVGTPEGRLRWDRFLLDAPIAGPIVRKAALARFARSMAMSSRSGVPIVEALSVVAATVDNAFIAGRVAGMRESVERGESLLRASVASGVFTPVVLQMIAIGEESCAVDSLMDEIADMYQREVESELESISARVEPILIIFLGILLTILALGIFQPLWGMGKVAIKR